MDLVADIRARKVMAYSVHGLKEDTTVRFPLFWWGPERIYPEGCSSHAK